MNKVPLLERALYNVEAREFSLVNNALAALTLISILGIILETVPALSAYEIFFTAVEWVTVAFFTAEYAARISVKRKQPLSYIFSFFGIVDLLAIVPTYLGLTNFTFLKTARVLRILRLLRIIRLAKLARLKTPAKRDLEDYSYLYRLNIQIYFFALVAAVIVFGTLIFIFETGNPAFASIPLGMLWALKPLLGGVSQIMPSTVWGEMVAVAARFTGLILFGLLIAIVGNTVRKALFGTADIETKRTK